MATRLPSITPTWHNTTYPALNPTQPHLSVSGKAILITGGGRGIGAEAARSFASAGAAYITLTGRTLSTLEATKTSLERDFPQTQILVAAGDVTDAASMESAFAALSQANGGHGVDICIHNAGYLAAPERLADADTADWWACFSTNVLGSFVVARAFLKHMNAAAERPVFVGLSSAVVALPPWPKYTGYHISKFAQSRFLEALAVEESGIRVMQVHPGAVETDMGKKSFEGGVELPIDDISLPANFLLWSVSSSAAWLEGKLIWSNWDVDELQAMKDTILSSENPGFLNLGMIGWPFPN